MDWVNKVSTPLKYTNMYLIQVKQEPTSGKSLTDLVLGKVIPPVFLGPITQLWIKLRYVSNDS